MKKTWSNNSFKESLSRPQIAIAVNGVLGKIPKVLIELFGEGCGCEFYAHNLHNLNKVYCIDNKNEARSIFLSKLLDWQEIFPKISFYFYKCDLSDFFFDKKKSKANVVNLDFCGYLYDNGKPTSTIQILKTVFKSPILDKRTILVTNFQLTGAGINFSKNGIKDRDLIISTIKGLAEESNWKVSEIISFDYKSSKQTRMLNSVFLIERP